jgi:DNA segregation ATPase FtsK/SpoIIIE-like protein
MVFGFYYAWIFVTQQEPQQIGLLDSALTAAVSRDSTTATTSITAYRALQSRIAIVTAAHSHIIEMGIMAMLLAFVQNFVFLSERWKKRWAILFCVGAAAMPVCTYTASIRGLVAAGFADTFGMLSLVALFAMLCGLVRQTGLDEGEHAS